MIYLLLALLVLLFQFSMLVKRGLWKFRVDSFLVHYQSSQVLLVYLVLLSLIFMMAFYLGFSWWAFMILLGSAACGLIFLMSWLLLFARHKQDFDTLSLLYVHMSSYFKISGKILYTLKETEKILAEAEKERFIHVMKEYEQGSSLKDAFRMYPAHYLLLAYIRVMEQTEHKGHSFYPEALIALDEETENWMDQSLIHLRKRLKLKNRLLLLTMFSVVTAFFSHQLLLQSLSSSQSFEPVFLFFLQMSIFSLTWAHHILSRPWLLREEISYGG